MPDYPNPDYQQTSNKVKEDVESVRDENSSSAQFDDNHRELTPDELSETIRKEKPSSNNVTAFATKPKFATFDSQLHEEEIALLLRRHPVTQLSKILIVAIAAFFPIVMFASPLLQFMPSNFKLATVISWYLVLSGFALESFLTWFFNVFIITNRRVIDVDFYSMVHKDVSSAKLESIQDMSVVTAGVFASLIDFGTLYVQTAGQNPKIEFEDIPHPSKVTKILNELIAKKKRMSGRRAKSI